MATESTTYGQEIAAPAASDEAQPCENCGHDVVGSYCAACGQKAAPFKRPLHHLGREVVLDYFGFDGKLWRTLGPLLLRPGFLTVEYLDGRRNRYVRPVRLYLTASIALFFLLSILPEGGFLGGAVQIEDEAAVAVDSLGPTAAALAAVEREIADVEGEIAELDTTRVVLLATRDSLQAVIAAGRERGGVPRVRAEGDAEAAAADTVDGTGESRFWEAFGEAMEERGQRIGDMGEDRARRWFVEAFTSNMPKAMFVLLPLFALFLKGLYVRRGRYYGEHLVFALHTHAFAFFAFAALALFLAVTGDVESLDGWMRAVVGAVVLGLMFSIPVYILLALKRVYGQGWIKTTLKWIALISTYNVVLGVAIVAVIVLAFFLL